MESLQGGSEVVKAISRKRLVLSEKSVVFGLESRVVKQVVVEIRTVKAQSEVKEVRLAG